MAAPARLRVYLGPRLDVDYSSSEDRLSLNPIARALWDERLSAQAALEKYGSLRLRFLEAHLADADIALLPRAWEENDRAEALAFIDRAADADLWTVVFGARDFEPVPMRRYVVVAHPGPQPQSRRPQPVLATPYLLTDRFVDDLDRPMTPRPVVSFCGQASAPTAPAVAQAGRRAWWGARWRLGRLDFVPPPMGGHVHLRRKAVRMLDGDPRLDTHFIIRDRYRAGVRTLAERELTEKQFWDNLSEGDYALCIRGSGNFSARFYEALSLGRIPVLVDTDCVLPASGLVDWDRLIIRVDEAELHTLGDRVADFHASLDEQGFVEHKQSCRSAWLEHLSTEGFFGHFRKHLVDAGWPDLRASR